MTILHINLLLLAINAVILIKFVNTNITQKIFLIITSLQLMLIVGLRKITVGTDTVRYYRSFMEINLVDWDLDLLSSNHEIGYVVLQKIITLFSNNFQVLLIVVAIISYSLLGIFIYRHSKNYFLSFLIFIGLGFYDFTFSGMRQAIAIMIVLMSYKQILKRNFLKFTIIIFIATLFHKTAAIFMIVYFISRIKWNRVYLTVIPFLYMAFLLNINRIGAFLSIIFTGNEAILSRYTTSNSFGYANIITIILLVGIIIYNPLKYKNDTENTVLVNIMVISIFTQSLSAFAYSFTRINFYFSIFIIIYIPHIFNNIQKMPMKLNYKTLWIVERSGKVILLILLSSYYLKYLESNPSGILPYNFFWNY